MGNYDGTIYTRETFKKHLDGIDPKDLSWIKFGVLHNTGSPNIAQARTPSESQRMRNAKPDADARLAGKGAHYWCFESGAIGKACALPQTGAHSPSWNHSSFGIEMVADFRDRVDDPDGAGKLIVDTAAWIFAQIFKKLGLKADATTIKLHKEDPKTTHDCPGNRIKKDKFISLVQSYMGVEAHEAPAPTVPKAVFVQPPLADIQKRLAAWGYSPGPIDGLWGPKTKAAVLAFQKAKGLKADAVVGPITWGELSKLTSTEKLGTKPLETTKPVVTPPVVEPVEPKPNGYMPVKDLEPSAYVIGMFKRIEGKGKPGKPFEAYDDRGTIAIGYGHNASSGRPPFPKLGDKITEAEADQILIEDLEAIKEEIMKVIGSETKLTQGQFDAFILDCYQRGQTQFTKTNAVKFVKEGDYVSALTAMYKASDSTADAGLKRRRKFEAQIFEGQQPTKW